MEIQYFESVSPIDVKIFVDDLYDVINIMVMSKRIKDLEFWLKIGWLNYGQKVCFDLVKK